ITNPTEPGDYTLEVETSEEDAVESATYEIEVPDVDVLPGIVNAYNSAGILMDSDTGAGAIQAMLNIADEGWTIKIGEGEYAEGPNTACADITIEGSGDLEDIVIEGNWTIDEDDVTLDNLTIDGDIIVTADDFILQNSAVDDAGTVNLNTGATDAAVTDTTFDVEDDVGIAVDEDDAVITGCTFTIEEDGVGISVEDGGTDTGVADSIFTGESGVGINVTNALSDLSVEDSSFDGLDTALDIDAGTVSATGNTILNSAAEAIIVTVATSVTLSGNTFTGNDAAAILQVADGADATNVYMLFNTIINNAGDEDLLIDNNDTDVDLIAVNNWWGDAAGPGDDAFSDDVVSEPFLAGAISVTAGIDAGVAAATIADFEDDVGVTVVAGAGTMDVVAASEYLVNPVAAISNAVGFWDVYVIGDATLDDIEIRIYTDVTEDTEVWVWGEARGEWLECTSYTPNLFSGFILVEVDAATGIPMVDDLEALPFAVIEPAASGELDDEPVINAPDSGADDISLTPTFGWTAVADADGYYFELADNANFVLPLVKLDGDTGRLIVTAYAYVGELPYSTPYYWRVKAVSGTADGGDLMESDWVSAVFITMDEPV
ncbi:MAG: right-handed parallel beta-helix repeat-containing protein, partial [Dehalococcoidia bacterium]|nr:right-handed parallel beta-helix repeat-containing protein [Dehalococcoidia bacterium]